MSQNDNDGSFSALLKDELSKLENKFGDEFKSAKGKIEHEVHKNPWMAIGIVAVIAFLLGLILAPRGSRRSD